MTLVKFCPGLRRAWMFPKNIRKIYPWKLAQICQLLRETVSQSEWTGDQDLQNQFSEALEAVGLKSGGTKIDPHSGGARTYKAQLECLGLIYEDNKALNFTLAGKSLIESEEPLKVLQTQLLNLQYPSSYSLKRNVKINSEVRIKPFLFILALLKDEEIQSLSREELIFPIIYGHNWDCFSICKDKILAFRNSGSADWKLFVDNPYEDLYTVKSGSDENIYDIANIAKNYLEAVSLIELRKDSKKHSIVINTDYSNLIDESLKNKDKFIAHPDNTVSFQRAFGAWNKTKDTSRQTQPAKKNIAESIILSHFMKYVGEKLVIDNADDFVQKMIAQGFKASEVNATIEPYIDKALSFFETKYIELSKGGTATATEFEKATVQLLKERLGIDARHIGSKRKSTGVGAYTDVIAERVADSLCGIIDTKASSVYSIPSQDYAKMVSNYIPNYQDVAEKGSRLDFVSYIAGGFNGEVNLKLKSLLNDTKIPASAVTAKVLIDASRRPGMAAKSKQVWEVFKKNKMLTDEDFNL